MYYKIINTESEVYKKLLELRTKELQMAKENLAAIEKKVELKFWRFLGRNSQQTFNRMPEYRGFKFEEPDKVDPKFWKPHTEHAGFFVPNKKTKAGREMAQFLLNGLKGSRYDIVFEILGLPDIGKFSFPYVEIVGDVIVVFLGDSHQPTDENLIEITRKEFDEILMARKAADSPAGGGNG